MLYLPHMTMRMRRGMSVLLGTFACLSLGAGCNPLDLAKQEAEKAKQEAEARIAGSLANTAMEKVTGGRVGLDAKDGQVTFVDKQSGTSYRVGENVQLPKDFPAELKVYPGAKVLAVTTGDKPSLSLKVDEYSDVVVAWYAEVFRREGWKETNKLAVSGYEGRSYAKDGVTVSLTFLGSRESGSKSTVVSLERKTAP